MPRHSPPLAGRYAPTLLVALVALSPFVMHTGAESFIRGEVLSATGLSKGGFELGSELATAAYAFGALLAGDLVNRLRLRRLYFACAALQAAGWGLVATAASPAAFIAGEAMAGLATGMLMVIALPPVISQFPPGRVPLTNAFVNLALFSVVASGPLVGGLVALEHGWRWLEGVFAALLVGALGLSMLTLPDQPPANPKLRFDWPALLLALVATVPPFLGAGAAVKAGFAAPVFWAPVAAGVLALVALLLVEHHAREPLVPVKAMWSTLPVVGVIAATVGGAVFVGLARVLDLGVIQATGGDAATAGLSLWPQAVGAALAAITYGFVLKSRHQLDFLMFGMLLLAAGATPFLSPGAIASPATLATAVAVLGFGAAATVSPGLFTAGFSLPSQMLARLVAFVELVRSIGDFVAAPILLRLAQGAHQAITPEGLRIAVGTALVAEIAGIGVCLALLFAGGVRRQQPDFEQWLGDGTALESPPLLRRLYGHSIAAPEVQG